MKIKQPILTEHEEAILLVDYLNLLISQGKVKRYTHVNNETYTPYWGQKRKNKRIGGYKGFMDYIILHINGLLFLELKKEKGGSISLEQKLWLDDLVSAGYDARIAHGFNTAKIIVDNAISKKQSIKLN